MSTVIEWPAGVPYLPLREPMQLTPDASFAATQMDGGWVDRARMFTVMPTAYQVDLELTLPQFELLRGWWRHSIRFGAAIFRMPVWRGWEYTDTLARMGVEPWAARMPDGDRWIVSVAIEILDMPTLTAEETAALQLVEMYGSATAATMLGDLHDLVHTTWPAAVTP